MEEINEDRKKKQYIEGEMIPLSMQHWSTQREEEKSVKGVENWLERSVS